MHEVRNLPKIYLGPGEFHMSTKPEVVVTVLGSCVAIVMHEAENKISAISHCVMPYKALYSNNDKGDSVFKYVDTTIKKMISLFEKENISRDKIKVKLFGGAEQYNERRKNISVGSQNIQTAKSILIDEGLKIISSDVGGNDSRKLLISAQTGEVYLTRIGRLNRNYVNHGKN